MKCCWLVINLFAAVFIAFLIASAAIAGKEAVSSTGCTGLDPSAAFQPVSASPATLGAPAPPKQPVESCYLSPWLKHIDDWELIASDSLTVFVPGGEHLAVYFDPVSEELGFIDPTVELTATQEAAIERAPAWLRADLYDNFRRFYYPPTADLVAQEILDADDPYVDEIAFLAAHTAPGILGGYTPQLIVENVQYVYAADSTLDYVQIVDYGDSNDDDYWSTALYRVVEESGDTVQIEIDRDIYYWYVVHPKLSDEQPTYIDPQNGQQASPPFGVFWRTYFWTHADSGYALLSEQFEGCNILWAHLTNTAGPANGAVGLVNDWINNVMIWGAGAERPIQPVRIYALHCGNCGEYSDITAAAGRTALIPTTCPIDYCEDHTWNEFWDRDWIAWEPVNTYVNSPLVYENGWGKVISAVHNYRGDGYVWTETERYSEDVCTLNVTVYDSAGKPADAQKITIESDALGGGLYYATWGITNSFGEVSFILGDEQDFYLRIDGPLGSYPWSGVVGVITNSQPGAVYAWDHAMFMATPDLGVTQAPEYPNPQDRYLMEVNYQCEYETAYGTYFNNNEFSEKMDTGITDVFVANDSNYSAYCSLEPAQGSGIVDNSPSGAISFVLPTQDLWYGVFSSRELSKNCPRIHLTIDVFRTTTSVPGGPVAGSLPETYWLGAPYPNPFNSEMIISFAIPVADRVRISVCNLLGQEVAILTDDDYGPGEHSVRWVSESQRRNALASGIYLVRMSAGNAQRTQKVCLLN